MPNPRLTDIYLLAAIAAAMILSWIWQSASIFPALLLAFITSVFSYLAYRFSAERFRLDLFDRRFEIYTQTLSFCSAVAREGTLIVNDENREAVDKAVRAAEQSFRGIGLHKSRALFGHDIQERFAELNKSYGWLVSFANPPVDVDERKKWANEKSERLNLVVRTAFELPDLFRPYIYFGDYKVQPHSLRFPIHRSKAGQTEA